MIPNNMLANADIQWKLTSARFEEWFQTELLRFRWWLLLLVFLFSIVVWWKTVDKSRLNEIILYAGIVTVMILILDELGEEMTLWDYPVEIFPLFPPIAAIDLASLPLVYSVIYQHFRTWKSFAIASIIMSVLSCFVLEPLFVLSGIYQMITWKTYYGLPLYFAIGICSKAIMVKIFRTQTKHSGQL